MSNADINKIASTFLSMGLFFFPLVIAMTTPTTRFLATIKFFHRSNSLLTDGRNGLRQNLGQGVGQRLWLRYDV